MILHAIAIATLVGSAAVKPDVAVTTPSVRVEMRQGMIVGLTNCTTGERYVAPPLQLPKLCGLHTPQTVHYTTEGARMVRNPAAKGAGFETQWPGVGRVSTRLMPHAASGGVQLEQTASVNAPGLSGASWGVAFIPERWEVLVPGNSGQRFSSDAPYETRTFEYPMEWEAPFVLVQGPKGGVLIQAADPRMRPKALTVERVVGGFRLRFESRNEAPFERLTRLQGCPWLIRAYKGPWQTGAALYRAWATAAYRLQPLAPRRPRWASEIALVAIVGMDIPTIRLLAQHVDPHKTLLYVPSWRKDGYDRNYPDYTPLPEFGPFVAEAHRLGFRVMPHVNYFGCDPLNPEYQRFRQYQMRDPYTGQPLWWDWKPAEPPIKFAYINPASRQWRSLFVERMKALCSAYAIDALHLDQTLCIFNDANGRIDGMSCAEGNIALHRELKEALPDVALSGEGLNEITCRYEQFAQRHVRGIDHVAGAWNDRQLGMAHPISSAVLLPFTTMYGYLGLPNPNQAPDLYAAWLRAYERFGVIPTYAWPTAQELEGAIPAGVRSVLRRVQLFMDQRPVPDLASAWQPDELFVWRLQSGGRMRYVRRQGVALEVRLAGDSNYRTVERRLEGIETFHGAGSVANWPAYTENAIIGLNPSQRYEWSPDPPDLAALHLTSLPAGWHVARTGRHTDLLRLELASHARDVREVRLWEDADRARAGVVRSGDRTVAVPGIEFTDDLSGGTVRPEGEGFFMHPPWKGLSAHTEERAKPRTFVEYRLQLPDVPGLRFEARARLDPNAGESDGVRFTVTARPAKGAGPVLNASAVGAAGRSDAISLDLDALRGKAIILRIEEDAGPRGDPTFDWGRLDRPRIVFDPARRPAVRGTVTFAGGHTVDRVLTGFGSATLRPLPAGGTVVELDLPNVLVIPFAEPLPVQASNRSAGTVLLSLADLPLNIRTRSYTGIEGPPPMYGPAIGPATCNGVERLSIHEHPPQKGCSLLDYHLKLPNAPCMLATAIGIRDGSKSAGVGFRVEVNGRVLFSQDLKPGSGWIPVDVDLAPYAGREIVLTLVTDALEEFNFDWAVWAEPKLVAQ